jgi:tetratricopeptide (TPR) repeat protein
VVLPPGSLPANVDRARYFDAVSAVEATGHMAEAHEAWLAALRRWPDAAVARFGAALTAYELGRPRDAAMWYRQLLDEQPEMLGARNNLALALAAQGQHEDALREIETVLHAVANDDPLVAQYRETYTQILSASH